MQNRQVVLARYFMVVLFGQVFGSLGGGIIGDYFGWRAVFAVTGCVVLLCFMLAMLQLQANPNAKREPLNLASIMARYRTVFQNRLALPLYALVMAEAIFIFAVFPFTAAILAERSGVGPTEAGFVVASTAIGAFAYTLVAPKLIPLMGVKRLAIGGAGLISLALLLFTIELPWQANIATFALHGGGFYMLHNNLQAQATELSQTARGSAVSLFAAFLFLGTALGPVLMGPMITSWGVRSTLVFFAVAVVFVGLAARHILPETQKQAA
jgi:MFS transporter, YNFM family, putative membrane transport protein